MRESAMTSAMDYQHPAFRQPADPNATLWRYMPVGKFKWLLSERRFVHARGYAIGRSIRRDDAPGCELAWWQQEESRAANEEQRAIIAHAE